MLSLYYEKEEKGEREQEKEREREMEREIRRGREGSGRER
jgi:hypothetical protein